MSEIKSATCTVCTFSEPVFDMHAAFEKYAAEKVEDNFDGQAYQMRCPECSEKLRILTAAEQMAEAVQGTFE